MASNTNIFAYRGRLLLSTYNESQKDDVPNHELSDLRKLLHNFSAPDESDEQSEPRKLDESDKSYGSGDQPVDQFTGVPHGVRVGVGRGVVNDRYNGYRPPSGGESSGGVLAEWLNPPVCIIGAGMAGLYTAMILESLMIRYHIVDANTRERVGGRVFTYKFPNGGPYDYFDTGAMRYPDTAFMKRTFDLVRKRDLKDVKLIPYIMEMDKPQPPNTFLFYNNARVNNRDSSVTGDPFGVRSYVTDPDLTTPQGVSKKVKKVLQPFRNLFRPRLPGQDPNIEASMKTLFEQTNKFSMRSYMLIELKMDPKDVNLCETFDKPTGWYDRALTQVVLENLAADWPTKALYADSTSKHIQDEDRKDPNAGWYCFDKGSSTLPQAMFDSLTKDVQDRALFESPVTAISRDVKDRRVMRISIKGVQSSQEYSAVICTVPLPCLSLMDLTGVNINDNYAQWNAIRELQYGPAIKIGLKFSSAWWETLDQPIHGGQSQTDLPLRTIVYPSYPEDATPETRSKVLIASYCRTEDAYRLGALTHPDGTAEPELIDIVFRDLAAVHGIPVNDIKKHYKKGDYFAWNWSQDPFTMGAYAFFGPGVYDNADVYAAILRPAARGKLFFAGEATSACHAWIAGALDSAWRAVNQYLTLHRPERREDFWNQWGKTEYWDETPKKPGLAKSDQKAMDRNLLLGERVIDPVPEWTLSPSVDFPIQNVPTLLARHTEC